MDKYTASNGGTVERFTESLEVTFGKKSSWLIPQEVEALREFFAQPEPKPWHMARVDEVWLLTIDGAEAAYRTEMVSHVRFFPIRSDDDMTYGLRSAEITAGRRVWPEPS